ncbi:hypothetical protein [Zhongshania sp.]|uniref:hypothetical protein n=1 Tax=Zhongshania sp. TaxID=1971902 RepID=UPI00356A94A0
MDVLNLEEERERLRFQEYLVKTYDDPIHAEMETQRRLVSTLEQLENFRNSHDDLKRAITGLLLKDDAKSLKIKKLEEQLEQAREALRKTHNQYAALTDYIRKRQGAHLGNNQGDVYHEMQAAASRFGLKSKHTSDVLVALGVQALKQQEVG